MYVNILRENIHCLVCGFELIKNNIKNKHKKASINFREHKLLCKKKSNSNKL